MHLHCRRHGVFLSRTVSCVPKTKTFEDDRMADTVMKNDDPSEMNSVGKKISNFNTVVCKKVHDTHVHWQ